MTCDICGRYADPDRETGYDADTVCPSCAQLPDDPREGVDRLAVAEQGILSGIEDFELALKVVEDVDTAMDLTEMIRSLAQQMAALEDAALARLTALTTKH